MDLVYMLKMGNYNPDLKYSLRSVQKYVRGYDRIWIVGFKPIWIQNVEYLKVQQNSSKYRNSLNNIIHMCLCNDISDNFVLMNDDFIAHEDVNIQTDLNLCLSSLDKKIEKFKTYPHSSWRDGFKDVKELLVKLGSEYFMDFEVHAPMVFNKNKFLSLINKDEIVDFVKHHDVLHYRTLYGNMYYKNPKSIRDVKISKDDDLTDEYLKRNKWISVYDGMVENRKYPKLNCFLKTLETSKYEKVIL